MDWPAICQLCLVHPTQQPCVGRFVCHACFRLLSTYQGLDHWERLHKETYPQSDVPPKPAHSEFYAKVTHFPDPMRWVDPSRAKKNVADGTHLWHPTDAKRHARE